MTPELRDEIIVELRKVRAPAKVARNLGIDLSDVLTVSDEIGGAGRRLRQEHNGGLGQEALIPFTVARKRAMQNWDNTDPDIAKARADYEAGTHEMCTGRDGDWLILYSIPRQKVAPRPAYFTPEI